MKNTKILDFLYLYNSSTVIELSEVFNSNIYKVAYVLKKLKIKGLVISKRDLRNTRAFIYTIKETI